MRYRVLLGLLLVVLFVGWKAYADEAAPQPQGTIAGPDFTYAGWWRVTMTAEKSLSLHDVVRIQHSNGVVLGEATVISVVNSTTVIVRPNPPPSDLKDDRRRPPLSETPLVGDQVFIVQASPKESADNPGGWPTTVCVNGHFSFQVPDSPPETTDSYNYMDVDTVHEWTSKTDRGVYIMGYARSKVDLSNSYERRHLFDSFQDEARHEFGGTPASNTVISVCGMSGVEISFEGSAKFVERIFCNQTYVFKMLALIPAAGTERAKAFQNHFFNSFKLFTLD